MARSNYFTSLNFFFFKVYVLNGTTLDPFQVVALYEEAFDRFTRDHPDFGGAKIIYAPVRRVDNDTMDRYMALASQLKVVSIK
jgi:adenosine deaminase CECR1